MRRLRHRAATVLSGVLVGVLAATIAPPDAGALAVASRDAVAYRVVQEALAQAAKPRAAEAPTDTPTPDETPGEAPDPAGESAPGLSDARQAPKSSVKKPSATQPEPVASGMLRKATGGKINASSLGVSAEFSGYEIADDLRVEVTELDTAGDVSAGGSAAAQTGGVVLGAAVDITATTGDGAEVTSFPAKVETTKDEHGVEKVAAVDPGIDLDFAVDPAALDRHGIDPASLAIYTRENDGEEWARLPSYYDADTGRVVGESDHLSQFVVIGVKFVPPVGPRIVLDPDDDYGWADTPSPASELPYNVALANQAAKQLEQACLAEVVVTRQADVRFVSGETRARIAAAHNPRMTVTLAFDARSGVAWGIESNGGTFVYTRGNSGQALQRELVKTMPKYTGRPAHTRAANAVFPDPAFARVPGAMVHMETLYLDHNYDRPVIDHGFASIVNGVTASLGQYAESLGFDCSDPVRGGLPAPPTKAELEKWRKLGHQNYQTYGADPVSFSTGNLVEDEPLFSLSGVGSQSIDFALVYNAQDGRLSRAGAGWSFDLGGRAQRFDDGSVLVVRGDGASFLFKDDGASGFTGDAGLGLTLREAGAGILELRSDAGESWRYDAADIEGIGELVSHTDRRGNMLTLGYGAPNDSQQFVPLTSVTDQAGQRVTVRNDSKGRITSIVHPDGRAWTLAYDARGDLVKITAPDGGVRSFSYDAEHRMLTATDALGVTYLRNVYDAEGRVIEQFDADGNTRTFSYGDGVTRYVDNEGRETVYRWDEKSRITGVTDAAGGETSFVFDTADRVTEATLPGGRVTRYEYDERGNVTREIRPDGGEWAYTWTSSGDLLSETDPAGRTTTHEVNAQGLRVRTILPDGGVVSYTYTDAGDVATITSPSGAVERYEYDGRGNVTRHVSPAGRQTNYTYDAANRLVSERDGAGVAWTYAYDASDNLVRKTDGLGQATEYTYDRNGHVLSMTAADGGVTRYVWDDLFRLAQVIDPEGGVTEYAYNREDALVGMTDPVGAETRYEVDPLARVTAVTDPLGGVWGSEIDAAGRVTETRDPLGRTSSRTYDVLGQVVSVTDPGGGVTRFEYDTVGNMTRAIDPEGGETEYRYDVMDRLVETVDPDGRVTTFHYDADGGLVAVEDPAGVTQGFTLDADGVILTVTDPLGAQTAYEYDAAGRVTAVVDPLGERSEYRYDAAGRLVVFTDPTGAQTRTEYDPVGRIAAITDADGRRAETVYDLTGRVTQTVDGVGATTRYAYDAAGRQVSTTDPEGRVTRYAYDAAGQLVGVTEGARPGEAAGADVNVRTGYTYTAAGELASVTNPLGEETRYVYDENGRLTKTIDAAGVVSSTGYDRNGRVVTESNGAGQQLSRTYTPGGLLTELVGPAGTTTFEYDGAGRPVVMRDPTGVTAWEYDAAGRMLAETSGTGARSEAAYDAVGRVVSLTSPEATVEYAYDAAGQLVSQATPWGDLAYAWSDAGMLTRIGRGDGVTTSYTYDDAGQVTGILHGEPLPVATPAPGPAAVLEVPMPAQAAASCPVDGVAGYLNRRALPNLEGEATDCVKTGAYLARRTMPPAGDPVNTGGVVRYNYGYNQAGQIVSARRDVLELPQPDPVAAPDPAGTEPETTPAPPAVADSPTVADRVATTSELRQYRYDGLGRLAGATVTDPLAETEAGSELPVAASAGAAPGGGLLAESTFDYDAAGNRILAETVTAEGSTHIAQEYGPAGRVLTATTTTSTAGAAGTGADSVLREYTYDGAGRRVGVSGDGTDSGYAYGWGGQPTRVESGSLTTDTAYDGLGRIPTQKISGPYGTDMVSQSFLGSMPLARSSAQHGDTALMWGVMGELAGTAGTDPVSLEVEARWALLDRLGSVVGEATGAAGGDISELAGYSDYGMPEYRSVGFSQRYGFTGEVQDGATGMVSFASRSYDPQAAAWTAPDAWPGLIIVPQSLNRYAYVVGDPVTLIDVAGFKPAAPGYTGSHRWRRETVQKAYQDELRYRMPYRGSTTPSMTAAPNADAVRRLLSPSGVSRVTARHATGTRICTGAVAVRIPKCTVADHAGLENAMRRASGNYDYSLRYATGLSGNMSDEEVFAWFLENIGSIFPLEGLDTDLRAGQRRELRAKGFEADVGTAIKGLGENPISEYADSRNPVEIVEVGRTSFTLKSLPTHKEGPGNYITFKFEDRGRHLSVSAVGPASPGSLGSLAQRYLWGKLVANIRNSSIQAGRVL